MFWLLTLWLLWLLAQERLMGYLGLAWATFEAGNAT